MDLPYQLLALDIDGTLMNSRNELPDAHRAALHRAHEAGLKISLRTGRSLAESRAVLDAIGLDLDAGIFVFGAVITDLAAGRTLSRSPLPDELTARLIGHFQACGNPVLILYDPSEAGYDYEFMPGERHLDAYEAWLRVSPSRVRRCKAWRPGPFRPVRVGVIITPRDIEATLAELRVAFPPQELKFNALYAPNYRVHVVECFAPQVNKWFGIRQLIDIIGIPGSRVVAVGDDVNDVEMIARSGLGVAMGNAVEAVRKVARFHVPSNNENGVAELVNLILEGKVPKPCRPAADEPPQGG